MNETREHSEAQEAAVQPDAEGLQGQARAPLHGEQLLLPHKRTRAFVSKGEKAVNVFDYGLVDWFINAALGVSFAFWGKRTESGQKYWSGPITGFFKRTLSPFIKNAEALEASATYGNMFVSIITGGMMTVPMLLGLENKHVKHTMVEWTDKQIYGAEAVENDPKFKQAYEEMDNAPKKKFWTGMYTRLMALSPLLALVLIPQTAEPITKHYFNNISKGTKWIGDRLGLGKQKLKEVLPGNKESHWDFIHDNFAMDFGLCLPYAALHGYFYNMFAGKPKASEIVPPVAAEPLPEAPKNSGTDGYQKRSVDKKQEILTAQTPTPVIEQHHGRAEHHDTVVPTADLSAAVS